MSKIQKIWFGVFLVMFLVPEILFGPILGLISNYNSNFWLPIFKNSESINDSAILMNLVLIVEFIAAVGITTINFKYFRANKIFRTIFGVLAILVCLYLLFATYLFNSLDNFFN